LKSLSEKIKIRAKSLLEKGKDFLSFALSTGKKASYKLSARYLKKNSKSSEDKKRRKKRLLIISFPEAKPNFVRVVTEV
jgi:hypothetical protein